LEPILSTRGLTIWFGGLAAINGVNFSLYEGEVKALIGPNGAGKTTFFNLISGNLQPTAGTILFRGRDITGLPPFEICRRGMSRTYQKNSLFPNLTVRENIRLGAHNGLSLSLTPFGKADGIAAVREKVEELMEMTGLSEKARQMTANLSHGDQRLLEIALGLSTNPTLLLLDEPTAGLSARETPEMTVRIKDLAAKSICNMIIVEHDMEVVKEVATSVTVLSYGEILCDGDLEEVRADRRVQEVYWGI
jgi:branched-chain amino acid transport system ATP-binding protein